MELLEKFYLQSLEPASTFLSTRRHGIFHSAPLWREKLAPLSPSLSSDLSDVWSPGMLTPDSISSPMADKYPQAYTNMHGNYGQRLPLNMSQYG